MITIPVPLSDEEVCESYGLRLGRLRAAAGCSQREVAERVGVSQPMVAKAETGSLKASEGLLVGLHRLYGDREHYPAAPRHPLRRVAWFAERSAGLPGSRDAAVTKRGDR